MWFCIIPFIEDSKKCKLVFVTEGKSVVAWGLGEGQEEGIIKGVQENFWRRWRFSLSWLWWWLHRCIHILALTKLPSLNMCSLWYANYTSIKLSEKVKKKHIHNKSWTGLPSLIRRQTRYLTTLLRKAVLLCILKMPQRADKKTKNNQAKN